MTEERVELGDVLNFMRGLWALDHALQSASKRMESTLGVTGPQRLVIRIVGRYPGISAGRLANIMHVHPSTLTGVLSRLEQRGVLVRKEDPADRRRALFSLTSRGSSFNVPHEGTVESAVNTALGQLPRRSVQAAAQVLTMVTDVLEEQRGEKEAAAPARRAAGPRAKAAPRRATATKRPAARRKRA
ncbi:MAG: MarR family transcriptional regulator [Myxococcaceae bacterium]|nr:MarR family transcriptional regulator [Myxococcaceae bacterium]MCI0672780.1 MarR family transcriptional regulator [Myxococcaceae bacterium]